jgi:short-subunit dehydrogenase
MSRPLALVTGASSGIGAAFARRLAAEGHDLVLVARDRARLEALARELAERHGAAAEVLAADLAEPSGLRRVEARIAAAPLELLVNNAGGLTFGAFHELERDGEEELVRVHAIAPLRLTHAALAVLLPRGRGAIVLVASRAAFGPSADLPPYAAAKAFLHRFAQGLAPSLEGTGMKLLSVCPGNVRTELFARGGLGPDAVARLATIEPEEVVDEALAALARGDALCVPGEGAGARWWRRAVPRGLRRKLARVLDRLG